MRWIRKKKPLVVSDHGKHFNTAMAVLVLVMKDSIYDFSKKISSIHAERLVAMMEHGDDRGAIVLAAKLICEEIRIEMCRTYLEDSGYTVSRETSWKPRGSGNEASQ